MKRRHDPETQGLLNLNLDPHSEALYRLRMFRGDRDKAIASLERDGGRRPSHYLSKAARLIRMGEVEWEAGQDA
jgi:hypothetical protein